MRLAYLQRFSDDTVREFALRGSRPVCFLSFCHFVHSFFLPFIVTHFPKIEKVCKLFFNLHTLFYKLIQGGNLEVLRVLLGHSSISITQIYIHLAAQMQLVNNKFDSHLDTLT